MRQTLTIADDVDNSTTMLPLLLLLLPLWLLMMMVLAHSLCLPLSARLNSPARGPFPWWWCSGPAWCLLCCGCGVARYAAEVCPVAGPVCEPSGYNVKSCRYQLVNGVCLLLLSFGRPNQCLGPSWCGHSVVFSGYPYPPPASWMLLLSA